MALLAKVIGQVFSALGLPGPQLMRGCMLPGEGGSACLVHTWESAVGAGVSLLEVE